MCGFQARKVREKEELAQCSFSPNINAGRPYLDMAAYTPIQHRFQDIMVSIFMVVMLLSTYFYFLICLKINIQSTEQFINFSVCDC
jgi:hypothetical protein